MKLLKVPILLIGFLPPSTTIYIYILQKYNLKAPLYIRKQYTLLLILKTPKTAYIKYLII